MLARAESGPLWWQTPYLRGRQIEAGGRHACGYPLGLEPLGYRGVGPSLSFLECREKQVLKERNRSLP
jgi:hypothetical protein